MDKVIITAAGYKGTASAIDGVPNDCPEALLPLLFYPYVETILGRLCRQLRDFERYIVIGTKDSTYSRIVEWSTGFYKFKCPDLDVRPWTDERIEYVSNLGNIIQIEDNEWMTMQNSICEAIDSISDLSGRTILTPGDQVYSDGLISDIVSGPYPRQYSRSRRNRDSTIFILDELATRAYRDYAHTHRLRGMRAWYGNGRDEFGDLMHESGVSTGELFAKVCPLVYIEDMDPPHKESEFPIDVDAPQAYRELAERWAM